MSKLTALATTICAVAIFSPAAGAVNPGETPFPAPKIGGVFATAQTVTADGVENDFFAPGSTVVFRGYAVDAKTHKLLVAKDVKFFYVKIPGQPNVKFKYDPKATGATLRLPWTASWSVPATYTPGVVPFTVLVKTTAKRQGQFVQFPIATSQLTITTTPGAVLTPAPTALSTAGPTSLDVSLYVDSVNGTRPAGAAPRPIGCTQTNVYKRGEQFVIRAWGSDLSTGDVLASDNIDTATATVPGQPAITLNWGAHGATATHVWYWTGAWNIPADYPLGDTTVHVVYKTDGGKIGTYDYKITIIP